MATRSNDEGRFADGSAAPRISAIRVDQLFGRLSYDYTAPLDPDERPTPLIVLYGDNGCGKTTILRIVHHLLSPADRRGHRTAIARIPFSAISISLSNGDSITATRSDSLIGSFLVEVRDASGKVVTQRLYKADESLTVKSDPWDLEHLSELADSPSADGDPLDRGNDAYLGYLKRQRFVPLFLRDERQMESDMWEDDYDMRRRHIEDPQSQQGPGERALRTALMGASNAIRDLSIAAADVGASGTNTVYLSVLSGLLSGGALSEDAQSARSSLESKVNELGERNNKYAAYGFLPQLETQDFQRIIARIPDDRIAIAQDVLLPFLTGLEKRLETLAPVFKITDALISSLNGFLTDKQVNYTPRTGLRVVSTDGTLFRPGSLSSGERHLLTLLCSAIIARRASTTFLIDEPEISLNVKWQRMLLPALMEITAGSDVQFLVASHSIEVLAPYADRIFHMGRG
ncbi:AAA domain-containing protein, putative AbiEii toxin, Type IV TA system [Tessaracoccus bendigoensis DSM 12906]|uniref:AAA domain-containing protein, putative AbiEii toxin, Type IV TA system n=1 Tax=Tessaracoccus bendigoensis DSM 12906 TaxID=1123357 RepID=A0A1M6EBX8_9ACTN|nr:AAA family ATPase [Tessaracoccus bendigoensis]SHI82808.1 AAA domain-containing protein, putative AbiEii toxin, Type IV TA system [Tessaracoccus bendigoensis DSM 12906]